MEDNSRDLLLGAIVVQFDRLKKCDDEKKRREIIANVSALYRLKLEEMKLDGAYERDLHKFEFDKKQYESDISRFEFDKMKYEQQYESDISKFEFDKKKYEEGKASEEEDKKYRDMQAKEQKIDKYIEYGIKGGTTVLMIIAYDIWYRRGLKFEETGTVSTRMTQNLIGKLLPRF